MADKPKSFEEFYYRPLEDIKEVEIVAKYVESHDGDYLPYKGEMFCPECYQAELTFVHETSKKHAYLRKIPSSSHRDGCSYNYSYASKKIVKQYIDSLNYNEVQDKLNSVMNQLLGYKTNKGKDTGAGTITKAKGNAMLLSVKEKEQDVLKALRRKRLSAWIEELDRGQMFVFYGKVRLEVAQNKNEANILKVYNYNEKTRGKTYRTSIYRGEKIDVIDETKDYYMVIIGEVGAKNYYIMMPNSNAFKYREAD